MTAFDNELEHLREVLIPIIRDINVRETARRCEVATRTVQKVLNGDTVTLRTMIKMAEALGCRVKLKLTVTPPARYRQRNT